MAYNLADLHVHSFCSDGLRTPTQAVEEARNAGVRALSLTDHDTVSGIEEASRAGFELGVEVVPGTELSAHVDDREVHLLAYFLDWQSPALGDYLSVLRQRRRERGEAMVERLNELGVSITVKEVLDHANGGLVARPHIAAAMIGSGAVTTKEEAFDRYIGDRGPAVVHKRRCPARDVIDLVHSQGGVAFLAHPGKRLPVTVVSRLVDAGLDGLEVFHPSHQPPQMEHYTNLAKRYDLLQSGGSDSHGDPDGSRIGDYGIGCEAIEAMTARAAEYA
mgnify:FL=1|jgi:hypothetical protein